MEADLGLIPKSTLWNHTERHIAPYEHPFNRSVPVFTFAIADISSHSLTITCFSPHFLDVVILPKPAIYKLRKCKHTVRLL